MPRIRDEDVRWAAGFLGPGLHRLFARMGREDRSHALRVARRVAQAGGGPELVRAALLHDVGKPEGYGLLWRTLCVLAPGQPGREPSPAGGRGFAWARAIYHHHEEDGLLLLREAGADTETLDLLQGRGAEPVLRLLREADDLG